MFFGFVSRAFFSLSTATGRHSFDKSFTSLMTKIRYWWKLFAFVYDDRTRFPDPVEEPGLIETSDLALLARLNYYGRPPAPGEGSVELLEVVDKRLRMRTIFDYVERVLVDRMVPPSEVRLGCCFLR